MQHIITGTMRSVCGGGIIELVLVNLFMFCLQTWLISIGHLLGVQRIVGDVIAVLVGTNLLRTVVVCPTTHVHFVFIAQVMEGVGHVAAATPFRSGPRLWQLELEIGENGRGLRDVRGALSGLHAICWRVRVTAHGSRPAIDQLALGHELIHLWEWDFKRTIDPAQLLQQLVALVVVAANGMKRGKPMLSFCVGWLVICGSVQLVSKTQLMRQ